MKKIYALTVLSSILICALNIFSFYLLNYPDDTEILKVITEFVDWKLSLIIFFIFILSSIIISFLLFKKQQLKRKFCISMISLNLIGIIFICVKGMQSFNENKNELNQILNEYRENAENDIKNDNVKYFSQGLMLPPKLEKDAKISENIEKLKQIYGLNHKNLGCIISPKLTLAQEEYEKRTAVYLEKRNGKNWEIKMRKQIDTLLSDKNK